MNNSLSPTHPLRTHTCTMLRRPALRSVGVLALLLTVTTTVFVTLLAVTLTVAHHPVYIPALAATILQFLSLGTLGYFTYLGSNAQGLGVFKRRPRPRTSLCVVNVVPAVLAAALIAVTFSWMKICFGNMPQFVQDRWTWESLISAFIIWGLSMVAQIVFFSICLLRAKPQPGVNGTDPPAEDLERVTSMQEVTRPATTESVQSDSSRVLALQTPRRSLTSLEAISSLRSSLSGVVRPTSSLTKLLPRHSSVTRDSKRSSFESLSRNHVARENSFDSWDTSAVGPHIREAVLQSTPPSAGSGLEPIPGSRPESPANALDGPFLPQSPTYSTPNFTRPFSRQRSSSDECHIHPLFRTNSPTPPPTPTPGTVVTAAPMAGQVINGRTLNRMRSGSLPSSPSPLIRSASFDAWSGARSFTPPTRGATPPIPDFILTAGAESGIDGYGKHRASLRSTEVDTGQ